MDHRQPPIATRRSRLTAATGLAVALVVGGAGSAPATSLTAPSPVPSVAVAGESTPLPSRSEQAGLVSDPVGPDVPAWSYALVAVVMALLLALVGRSFPARRVSGRGRRER